MDHGSSWIGSVLDRLCYLQQRCLPPRRVGLLVRPSRRRSCEEEGRAMGTRHAEIAGVGHAWPASSMIAANNVPFLLFACFFPPSGPQSTQATAIYETIINLCFTNHASSLPSLSLIKKQRLRVAIGKKKILFKSTVMCRKKNVHLIANIGHSIA